MKRLLGRKWWMRQEKSVQRKPLGSYSLNGPAPWNQSGVLPVAPTHSAQQRTPPHCSRNAMLESCLEGKGLTKAMTNSLFSGLKGGDSYLNCQGKKKLCHPSQGSQEVDEWAYQPWLWNKTLKGWVHNMYINCYKHVSQLEKGRWYLEVFTLSLCCNFYSIIWRDSNICRGLTQLIHLSETGRVGDIVFA